MCESVVVTRWSRFQFVTFIFLLFLKFTIKISLTVPIFVVWCPLWEGTVILVLFVTACAVKRIGNYLGRNTNVCRTVVEYSPAVLCCVGQVVTYIALHHTHTPLNCWIWVLLLTEWIPHTSLLLILFSQWMQYIRHSGIVGSNSEICCAYNRSYACIITRVSLYFCKCSPHPHSSNSIAYFCQYIIPRLDSIYYNRCFQKDIAKICSLDFFTSYSVIHYCTTRRVPCVELIIYLFISMKIKFLICCCIYGLFIAHSN